MSICVNCVEALSKITYKHFLTVISRYLTQEHGCWNNLRWFLELVKLNSVLPPACECLQEFLAQHPLDAESKTVAEGSLSQHQDGPGRFLLLDIEKKRGILQTCCRSKLKSCFSWWHFHGINRGKLVEEKITCPYKIMKMVFLKDEGTVLSLLGLIVAWGSRQK